MKSKKNSNVKLVVVIVAIVIVLMVLLSSLVITNQGEYTVIRQFGEVVQIIENPGVALKVPVIQTASKISNKVMLYDLPISDVITEDKKTMVADSFVMWQITDPRMFIQTLNGSIPNAESRISSIVYNSLKNTISSREQSEVISGRDGELALDILEGVGDSLDGYGIEIKSIETKRLDLPDDNKSAVYQRMISERSNIAASFTAEGESEAQKIRSSTDREVTVMISQAEADAEALIAEGEAEYMSILSSAYNDPDKAEFYTFVRSLDAAKASLAGRSDNVLFLGPDSPLAEIFYNAG